MTNIIKADTAINELISNYINQADVSELSKISYKNGLNNFINYIEENNINAIERKNILAYKYDLLTKYTPNTVNTYLSSVRAFYEYLEVMGISKDITKGVKGAKAPQSHAKEALTVEQTIRLLNSFDLETLTGMRDYAMLNLMINTGLRVMEVQTALVTDIAQSAGKAVLYIQGKGRDTKDNMVILEDNVLQPIREYISKRKNEQGALFQGIGNRSAGKPLSKRSISRIAKEAFISIGLDSEKITAHSTRHTAVTLSLLGGATVQEAQAMARHSNINTTMIYSHNINRIENSAESKISSLLKAQ